MIDEDEDLITDAETKQILKAMRAGHITREELEKAAEECEVGCVATAELVDGQAGLSAILSKSVTPTKAAVVVPNWGELLRSWTTAANTSARVLEDRCHANEHETTWR
jgi:hypothetical protein